MFHFKPLQFYELFYHILLEPCKSHKILECLHHKNLSFECVFYGDVSPLCKLTYFVKIYREKKLLIYVQQYLVKRSPFQLTGILFVTDKHFIELSKRPKPFIIIMILSLSPLTCMPLAFSPINDTQYPMHLL